MITLDTYKQQHGVSEAFNLQELFNGRVGDEQVPLVVKFLERGKAQQFEDGLVPFMSGFVGNLDDSGKVTAETGEPVSYTGSRDEVVGLGMVKMNLPGTMFPQEGYFYGFLGLETPDHSKRVSTFSVWFHVYNGNPDMFVNREPFRTELQKLLDEAEVKSKSTFDDIQKQWEILQDTIQKMINSGNTDLDTYLSRLKLAEERLDQYEKDLAAGKGVSQAALDSALADLRISIKDGLAELTKTVPIDNALIIGGPISADEKNVLDRLRSTVDTTKFNLLFINDSHYGMQSDIPNYGPRYGINHLNTALYLDDLVNVVVAGGDNIDGHLLSTNGLLNDEKGYALDLLFGSPNHADKFALRGNHDDGSLRLRWFREGSQYAPATFPETISEAQFKADYVTGGLLFNEHRQGDSAYFYKDYPDFKVRVIGLNSNDVPEDVKASDGGIKYPGLNYMGYRQTQLDWLANIALQNVPEEYVTIIVAHVPATPTALDDDLSDPTLSHYTNQKQVNQIINDFKNGQTSVITNNVKDWEIKVKTNFVTQGKRDMAAWIHGHLHYEESTTSNGFNDISCVSSIPVTGFNKGSKNGGWSLFTLDPDNRKLKVTGYGMATNRSFDY